MIKIIWGCLKLFFMLLDKNICKKKALSCSCCTFFYSIWINNFFWLSFGSTQRKNRIIARSKNETFLVCSLFILATDMQIICLFPRPNLWIFNNFHKTSNKKIINLDIWNQFKLGVSSKIDKMYFIAKLSPSQPANPQLGAEIALLSVSWQLA